MRPGLLPRARHRLGQHFLVDESILDRIAAAADLTPEDTVLEIGAGTGTLTARLARQAGRVVAIEIDERMRVPLTALATIHPELQIIWGDFLRLAWSEIPVAFPIKVVANIPYYITTPILFKLLQLDKLEQQPLCEIPPLCERIVIMIQAEVAKRLLAQPGNKDYASLSVVVQYAATVEQLLVVARHCFVPRPQVDSAVVCLKPRPVPPVAISEPRLFFRVIRGAFAQRRKTLGNALLASFPRESLDQAFSAAQIDPRRRGETLTLAEFASLANELSFPC